MPLGRETVLYEAYIAYQAYFNESKTVTAEEIYDQYDIREAQFNTEILAYCAFLNNLDTTQIPNQIDALRNGKEADAVWKESIISFAECFSLVFESPETQGLPKFMIETKCDIREEISQVMDELSYIRPVNYSLIEYAKELSTIQDMETFSESIDRSEVEDLALATKGNIRRHKGYIVRGDNGNSFHRELPKEFCVQHLTANLAKYLHQYTRMDITEV